MKKRININALEPNAYQSMLGLEKYSSSIDLEPSLKELVKIRASQVNGCAYCIQMHTEQARKQGETEQRIYALSVWKESPLFSNKERSILALTEEVTRISVQGLSKATYENALEHLGEKKLAQSIMLIVISNAWNRIAVSTNMQHERR